MTTQTAFESCDAALESFNEPYTPSAREQRGAAIPNEHVRKVEGGDFKVRSSDGKREYRVRPFVFCTCGDFTQSGMTCKHLYKVQSLMPARPRPQRDPFANFD
ncbi:MAG TPA: hypothetical protein VI756_25835 [Blastocatellia bacterium]